MAGEPPTWMGDPGPCRHRPNSALCRGRPWGGPGRLCFCSGEATCSPPHNGWPALLSEDLSSEAMGLFSNLNPGKCPSSLRVTRKENTHLGTFTPSVKQKCEWHSCEAG